MIKKIAVAFTVISWSLLCSTTNAVRGEVDGSVSTQARLFLHSPSFEDQKHYDASVAGTAEYYREISSAVSVTIMPFARFDGSDSNRTHADLRELSLLYQTDDFEATVGISKVFWGATEFVHLVDIINQTDLVEAIDGEEKLGQPMFRISIAGDWGVVDAFLLPIFRERTFPGQEGRLRTSAVIDRDSAAYESGMEKNHPDFAVRYSHSQQGCDFGISEFLGTSREPTLLIKDTLGDTELYPYYPQITQTGIDLQMVQGEWLWKGEALYRTGQGRDFLATTFGFEYTFHDIFGSAMDVGLLAEYVFDNREDAAATLFENDIMAGIRWAANDAEGTEFLAGIIQDIKYSSVSFTIAASRRLGESMKLQLEAYVFGSADEDAPLFSFKKDDFVKLELITYF